MTVEIAEEMGGKVLTMNLSGKLTRDDYVHFTPVVERAVKAHGKIRMLVRLHDFHGWTVAALWDDLNFDLHHFMHIERLAFVGDKLWEAGMAVFCKPFTTAKVRYFDEKSRDEAATWIHDGIGQESRRS